MKIELQEPYKSKWRLGYLVVNPEGRKTVLFYNNKKDRSSTSYARYLMSVKLGEFLDYDQHVDHIDNDKTNDSIDNLQILSPRENNKKSSKAKTFKDFICPICGIQFRLELRQSHKNNPTCSRKCGGIKSSRKS